MASPIETFTYMNYELEPSTTTGFKEHMCSVCMGLLDTPVRICKPEEHLACLKCANRLAESTGKCPLCNVTLLKDFSEDKNSIRLISSLSVKCPAKCGQNINIGDIEDHVSRFCTKVMVTCDLAGCPKKMPASELDNHKKNMCDYRLTACQHCGDKYIFRNQENHLAFDCEAFPKKIKIDCEGSNVDMDRLFNVLRSEVNLLRRKALPYVQESECQSEIPPILQNLFSPSLPQAQLVLQLTELKKMNATIAGISFEKFSFIRTLDISRSGPIYAGGTDELNIIHGTFDLSNRRHWIALKNSVFAGNLAPVQLPQTGRVIFPKSEPAIVIGHRNALPCPGDVYNWSSQDSTGKTVVDNQYLTLGAFPAVFLKNSSLLGIKINCNSATQGLVAVHGAPVIAHCVIQNSRDKGILFYDVDDCPEVRNTTLELAPRLNHPGGIVSISGKRSGVRVSVLTSQNTITHKHQQP